MIDVSMGGDDRFAIRQREVELADHLHDFIDRFIETDVDQHPFGLVVYQVDVAAESLAGLIVHLDDVRKDRLPFEHGSSSYRRALFFRPGFPSSPRFYQAWQNGSRTDRVRPGPWPPRLNSIGSAPGQNRRQPLTIR